MWCVKTMITSVKNYLPTFSTMKKMGVTCAYFGLVIYFWPELNIFHFSLTAIIIILMLIGKTRLIAIYRTAWRDLMALMQFMRLQMFINWAKMKDMSIVQIFQKNVRRHPNKIAFYYEDETWTFQEVEDYSNKVANYFRGQGIKHGDSVAIMMENRIEYTCIWLGLAKLGAVPAFINTNLRSKSLAHCILIVDSVAVIFSCEFESAIKEIETEIKSCQLYKFGKNVVSDDFSDVPNLHEVVHTASTSSPPEINSLHFYDKLVYIYTSGTTGLPKAAVVTHCRALVGSYGMISFCGMTKNDILYNPLPMYHTVGGILGPVSVMIFASSIAIRRKFSASNYWADCVKYNCTIAQYIGELCRYLLNTPPRPEDTQHKVKIMYGNGLRAQIWKEFQDRFKIKRICEFYGATEGNAHLVNMVGKTGAVGFVSVILPKFYPCGIIKIDEESGAPLRGKNGLCVLCKHGEPGEFVGLIGNNPFREFDGYADKKATESKIVTDVWKKGDKAFLTGDILVMDEEGFVYFRDRRGDTFRWRGENVSTTELEGLISKLIKNLDVAVYGVEIPGSEGRAGMATILDPEKCLIIDGLPELMVNSIPSYARPIFLRIVNELDMTGTFKLIKTKLQKEGYDVTLVSDKLYYLDQKLNKYIPLTNEIYEMIQSGKIRF